MHLLINLTESFADVFANKFTKSFADVFNCDYNFVTIRRFIWLFTAII